MNLSPPAPNPLTILFVLLFVGLTGVLLKKTPDAAAMVARSCTTQPQAGITQVQLDSNGYSLTLIPLPVPFCNPYSVVITPQGSGSAAAFGEEELLAEFEIERYFVDTFDLNAFVIGAKGTPNAAAYFQWIALPRTQ